MQPCPAHPKGETYAERLAVRPHAALYRRQRWQRLSRRVRSEEMLCRVCKAAGRTRLAAHADHVRPHRGDLALFWDRDNLQALCHECHSAKTRRGE